MQIIKFDLNDMEKKQDGFSCYILGRSYDLEENGAKQDYSRALMWYNKGIEQKNPLCVYSLGISYEMGLGKELKIDVEKGEYLLKTAYPEIMQLINKNIENKNIISAQEVDLKKYMTSIKQNCYRLLRLVNNIIDMNKIDYGYYDIELGNYNIVSVVEDITMSVLEYIKNKGIELIFDTDTEEEIIACDPDKIERIILNLLSNAIKYTRPDGKIIVNINSDKENVYISVKDTGIGMPKQKLNKIFNRYEQIDNKLTKSFNGSGIGLSLVKSLVEMHKGKITVESKENEGSKFTITLPKKRINNEHIKNTNLTKSRVEKCNIEFSDIYN